jgi:hypothetical protein
VYRNLSAGGSFDFSRGWSTVIAVVVVNVCIVDDGCLVVNVLAVSTVISVHISVIHSVVRNECPVTSGQIYVDVDVYAGSHGCPSVITATTSPGYPCWCPFVTGYPAPSVVVVEEPTSVMEGSPSPRVVRYPGVPIIGHHPITIGSIGMKIPANIGNPHTTILVVVDPPAIWC